MTTRVQHRRSNTTNVVPAGMLAGELNLNMPDRELFMGDGAGGTVPMLAVKAFSATASYASGAVVLNAGLFYRANAAVPPGAFNSSQWTAMVPTLPAITEINPADFGAVGDNVADDTTALQNALNNSNTTGRPVRLAAKTYKLSAPGLTVTGRAVMTGVEKNGTTLSLTTNNMTGITCSGATPVCFERFRIQAAAGVTGAIGIIFSGAAENSQSIMRDMTFLSCQQGVNTQTAYGWTIDNCHFLQYGSGIGLVVRNSIRPDAGDSCVSNCYFAGGNAANGTGITQQSSGGLKIINTKFVTNYIGYQLALDANAVTGDLLISNCSFENGNGAGVQFTMGAAGGNFHSATISGCQFNLLPQAVSVLCPFAAGWLTDLSVSGGCMFINAAGVAMNINGANGLSLSGMNVYALGAGVSVATCGVNTSNGVIAPISYFGAGISGYINNAGNNVMVQPLIQRGSSATGTASGYGSCFAGTGANINFPRPYIGNPPQVIVTPTAVGAGGAISAFAVGTTITGFSAQVVAAVNNSVVNYDWVAMGNW